MILKGKKVLITGSEGFIGSHLAEFLVRYDCQVKAFVLYNSFNSQGWLAQLPNDIRDKLEIHVGDIRDPVSVDQAVEGCDVVFHLAALIAVPYSYSSPGSYIDTNVQGTLNILQASKKCGVKKVLHTSTSEVYGSAQFVPMTEKHPLVGQSPYSASKTGADQLVYSFFASYDLPASIVRPFNTYGPRQSLRAIIPTVITQILGGQTTLRVGSLSPRRDFIFIEDTIRGFISIAESNQSVGEVINLCTGFDLSIEELIHLVAQLMGTEIKIESHAERIRPEKSEVKRLMGSNEKALSLCGWKPQYESREGLTLGLEKTIRWFMNEQNRNPYRPDHYCL